jgi:hypothetical protein
MPGYSKDIEKIIEQIFASAKTRFNYEQILTAFGDSNDGTAEIFADYLV